MGAVAVTDDDHALAELAAGYLDDLQQSIYDLGRATAIIGLLLHDNTAPTTRRIALQFIDEIRQVTA